MSPRTKSKVKWVRVVQLLLRICAILGAAGLLVCVICIRPTGSSTDWIIRVPPGIAIFHCMYAIYHLSRSSKGRTPSSSASYHIFASIMDAGLVPFLAFTALMAYKEQLEPINDEGHWKTLFGTDFATEKVTQSTFLIATTTGGIHVASLCISVYLALMFRKISQLPPDMNPLEDNLTSRTRSHKRNKSSLSMAVSETAMNRDSHLSAPLIDSPTNRTVPFIHTRNDSAISFGSPTRRSNPHARNDSRNDLPSQVYHQPASQRSSRNDIRRSPERTTPKRSSGLAQSTTSTPTSHPASTQVSPQRQALLKEPSGENWFVHASPTPSPERETRLPFDESPPEFRHLRTGHNQSGNAPYAPPQIGSYTENHAPTPASKYDFNRTPKPLEMNPPTPPVNSVFRQNRERFEQRALKDVQANTNSPSSSLGNSPATWEERSYQPRKSFQDSEREGYGQGTKGKSRFYGNLKDSLRVGRRGSRVVSSGVDIGDERQHMEGFRGREVSGKVAEEGRAF